MNKVNFIYETKKWSIYDDGLNIQSYNKKIILTRWPIIIPFVIKILHLGSINLLFKYKFLLPLSKFFKQKIICSWFHIDDASKNYSNFENIFKYVDLWHVTNLRMKENLVNFGIDEFKIIIINLGYNNEIFYKYEKYQIDQFKMTYNIPNRTIFGSFVKDSPGFGNSERVKKYYLQNKNLKINKI